MSTPYKWAKRMAVGLVGGTVLLLGIVMIVTPGPAFIVIPAGLAILGIEFAWARRWLKHVKEKAQSMMNGSQKPQAAPPPRPDAP